MDDPIEKLLESIRGMDVVQRTMFTKNFINNVGELFERDGFGVTRVYLLERRERRQLSNQANALMRVLDLMESRPEIRQKRSIGRAIFKTLIALKKHRVPSKEKKR